MSSVSSSPRVASTAQEPFALPLSLLRCPSTGGALNWEPEAGVLSSNRQGPRYPIRHHAGRAYADFRVEHAADEVAAVQRSVYEAADNRYLQQGAADKRA